MYAHRVKVVVFCHVESGTMRDRQIIYDRSREEGITAALPRIVEFAENRDIPITFALTAQSLTLLPIDLGGFPTGIHLHPQDAALRFVTAGSGTTASDCLRQYTLDQQRQLATACEELHVDRVGRRPGVFVAGNWSENTDTIRVLEELRIPYDGSPLPGHLSPCADWSRLPRLIGPYHPDTADIQKEGTSRLCLFPVFRGAWGEYLTPELLHLLGVSYFRAALLEATVGGLDCIALYFHSPMAIDAFYLDEFGRFVEIAQDDLDAQFVRPEAVAVTRQQRTRAYPPAYLGNLNFRLLKHLAARRFAGVQRRTG